jgi:hypothetical protein
MAYIIKNTEGRQGRAWSDEYETRLDASAALQIAMGWETIVLSNSYSVTEGKRDVTAWSAYETVEERDADSDGAYAPRIIEI